MEHQSKKKEESLTKALSDSMRNRNSSSTNLNTAKKKQITFN